MHGGARLPRPCGDGPRRRPIVRAKAVDLVDGKDEIVLRGDLPGLDEKDKAA